MIFIYHFNIILNYAVNICRIYFRISSNKRQTKFRTFKKFSYEMKLFHFPTSNIKLVLHGRYYLNEHVVIQLLSKHSRRDE